MIVFTFGAPRRHEGAHVLRRQVRRVGLDQQAVERDALGGVGELGRLRVGHVAGERDPPAFGQALVEAAGHREAVHDDLDPFGVLAQRLVRRICSNCRAPYDPPPEELIAAKVTKQGRRMVNVFAEAWQDDRSKPVATANAHFLVTSADEPSAL